MWDEGYFVLEIAKALGKDHTTILHHLIFMGIDPGKNHREYRQKQKQSIKASKAIVKTEKIQKSIKTKKLLKIIAKKLAIAEDKQKKVLENDRKTALRLWNAGKSYVYIAHILDCSLFRVQSLLKYSEEYTATKASRNRHYNGVIQMSIGGKKIKKWKTVTEAAKSVNTWTGNIVDAAKGRIPSAKGYKWKYVE